MTASDLNELGACFAPAIPDANFVSLSETDFRSKIAFFQGSQFQPSSAISASITSKIR